MPLKPKKILLQRDAADSRMADHVCAAHPDAKQQRCHVCACEARRLEAHQMMACGPLRLEAKPHKPSVTTYPLKKKSRFKQWFREKIAKYTPYAHIRYMF